MTDAETEAPQLHAEEATPRITATARRRAGRGDPPPGPAGERGPARTPLLDFRPPELRHNPVLLF